MKTLFSFLSCSCAANRIVKVYLPISGAESFTARENLVASAMLNRVDDVSAVVGMAV